MPFNPAFHRRSCRDYCEPCSRHGLRAAGAAGRSRQAGHRHLFRRLGDGSVSVHGEHEGSGSRGVDEGAGGLHACRAVENSRPRGTVQRGRGSRQCGIGAGIRRSGRRDQGLLPEAARRREHRQALRARRFRRRGATARRSRHREVGRWQAQCDRLVRAVARQQVSGLRDVTRRFRGERASYHRGRHRQADRRCDRSRQFRQSVLARRQPVPLQPPAKTVGRRTADRQISKLTCLRPQAGR